MVDDANTAGVRTQELRIPSADGGEDLHGVVLSIAVDVGDRIDAGDTVLEVETDKVVLDIPADCGGTVQEICVAAGDEVRAGLVFARVTCDRAVTGEEQPGQPAGDTPPDGDGAANPDAGRAGSGARASPPTGTATVPANPSARRLARQLGVDIRQVAGSGRRGRITKQDVTNHGPGPDTCVPGDQAPSAVAGHRARRAPLSGIAAATCRNMQRSWSTIPHAWLQQRVDVTGLEEWRQRHKQVDEHTRLTMTVFMAKSIAAAAKISPIINSSYDEEKNEVVFRDTVDLGIAVDTEHGLLVPVLRDIEPKGIAQLARELQQLVERARQRDLSAGEMKGGSITLSNLGSFGLDVMFPIVNWPQAAIVGAGAAAIEPVYRDGAFVPRSILTVTLGFDHRIVNGADGARFLARLRQTLEDPMLLL